MTFGFPAYHQETIDLPASDLRATVRDALDALGWKVKSESAEEIVASAGVSFWSWGERVVIQFPSERTISVRSSCAMPTQCVDWGKNQRNVVRFRGTLAP